MVADRRRAAVARLERLQRRRPVLRRRRSPRPRCSTRTSAPRSRSSSGSRWDYVTGRKPTLIGSVNGMIVGLVAITPAAGFVNGWGAIAIGVIALDDRLLRAQLPEPRCDPFRIVDDTLGVVYTHGFAGLAGGLLVGIFADTADGRVPRPAPGLDLRRRPAPGSGRCSRCSCTAALWVIVLLRDRHVHPAQAGRPGRAAADERGRHGDRRPRRPRARGVPVGRARRSATRRGPRLAPADAGTPAQPQPARLATRPTAAEPPRLSRGRFPFGGQALARRLGAGRATSRSTSSIVATAGVTRPPRGVAAKTWRTGLLRVRARGRGCRRATRRERELRDQRHADARRDQALHRLVVVALEGDARLEPRGVAGADDVAGAGARRPRSAPTPRRAGPRGAGRLRPASGWSLGQRQVHGVLEQLEAAHPGRRAARRPPRTRTAARGRTRPRAAAARSPPARPRRGVSSTPGWRGAEARRSPAASASRRRSGTTPSAAGRRGPPRSPRARPRRPPCGPGSRRRASTSAAPAAVGRTPPRSRSISVAPVSASSVAIACETADCE